MTGRVAQPLNAADLGQTFEQPRQRPRPAIRSGAVIGIDVLSDQRDFAHAGVGQPLDLGHDLVDRAGGFGAARKRHDAERAELVAAFLHGDEGGDAARAHGGGARRGEVVELVVDGKLGIDGVAVALGARMQLRQAMIVLRSDHEIDRRRPADDFFALGLRHAAGDRDEERRPSAAAACFSRRMRPSSE